MSDLVETNVLQNQSQTGQIEIPTILTALKDSGAVDVTLEEDEQDSDAKIEKKNKNREDADYSDKRRHQHTQTELFALSVAEPVVNEPLEERRTSVSTYSIQTNVQIKIRSMMR